MLFRDLSSPAKRVWLILNIVLDNELGSFDYSSRELANAVGCSVSTIRRGLDDLVKYGILKEFVRAGLSTIYTMIEIVEWKTQEEHEFSMALQKMSPKEIEEHERLSGDTVICVQFGER